MRVEERTLQKSPETLTAPEVGGREEKMAQRWKQRNRLDANERLGPGHFSIPQPLTQPRGSTGGAVVRARTWAAGDRDQIPCPACPWAQPCLSRGAPGCRATACSLGGLGTPQSSAATLGTHLTPTSVERKHSLVVRTLAWGAGSRVSTPCLPILAVWPGASHQGPDPPWVQSVLTQ